MKTGRWCLLAALVLLLLSTTAVKGQEDTAIVPDLVGLNVPSAAAELNRAGLTLGAQSGEPWTEASPIPRNAISAQAIPAGQAVAPGTAVDVVVLQIPNVMLVYDEGYFTIVNQTGAGLRLDNLSFQATEGGNSAALRASRWTNEVRSNYCVQAWALRGGVSRQIEGCAGIQYWLAVANNPSEQFWTGLNGVTRFAVIQDGAPRAVCEAAPPGSGPRQCSFYSPVGISDDLTEYVYFAYTPTRLIIFNRSEDRWMPLRDTAVLNNNPILAQPGAGVPIGDPALYASRSPVADVSRLAPGQCALFTKGAGADDTLDLPQTCDVVARLDVNPDLIFWSAPFTVKSATNGQQHTCAAATEGRLTLCIMPR